MASQEIKSHDQVNTPCFSSTAKADCSGPYLLRHLVDPLSFLRVSLLGGRPAGSNLDPLLCSSKSIPAVLSNAAFCLSCCLCLRVQDGFYGSGGRDRKLV